MGVENFDLFLFLRMHFCSLISKIRNSVRDAGCSSTSVDRAVFAYGNFWGQDHSSSFKDDGDRAAGRIGFLL